jgi:DnaA-homolog protein
VTRQLALPMQQPAEPSLDNFVPGSNGELLERLRDLAAGRCAEAVIYLWGAPGSGRTHLLKASARAGLTIADDVERLGEAAHIALFNAINQARDSGSTVLAAGAAPPAQLALREDLRSRLGWGLVYEVKSLTDAEKADYLRAEAARRGLKLSNEVIGYVLTHVRRDMPSLVAILEHLDRTSLEQRRAVTLPLVREALRALEP